MGLPTCLTVNDDDDESSDSLSKTLEIAPRVVLL